MTTTGGLASLTPDYLVVMFLMVVRVSAMLLTVPILGTRTVPAPTKIGMALVLCLVLLPMTAPSATLPPTFFHLLVAIGKETLVGILAGFSITLLQAALQLVATIAGVQIGFGFSGTVDANFAGQSPVLDHLFTGLALLIFLSGNFHHQMIIGMQQLFSLMPPNNFSLLRISPEGLIVLSTNMFLVALRIVLPLLGVLLLTELALGIMARTAPQMNVFFVGMPAKMAIGIFAIMVMLPFVVARTEALFAQTASAMAFVLRYQ